MMKRIAAAVLLLAAVFFASTAAAGDTPASDRITVDELKAKMDAGEDVVVVDMRAAGSYHRSDIKIKGDIRIMYTELPEKAASLPKDKEIVIYCT